MNFIQNWLLASAVQELRGLKNEQIRHNANASTSHNWDDPDFIKTNDLALDEFYARHPEINRENGEAKTLYPDKWEAVKTLNEMSERNAITPREFNTLYAEILNF